MRTLDTSADIGDLRGLVAGRRARGPVGFVPTMGALHAGHLSLVDEARSRCRTVVASIFVNPLQFGPNEDFERYPRDPTGDAEQLAAAGVDLLFTPRPSLFVPAGRATDVTVAGPAEGFEGALRPGHFVGVATIVTKLFNVVQPDVAFFGEKDLQQLAVIQTMTRDLNMPVEVVGCPTVRDTDGLALSSRNVYLTAEQREVARAIPNALRTVVLHRSTRADEVRGELVTLLGSVHGLELDYADVVDPDSFQPLTGLIRSPAAAVVAARVGPTRLLDNARLDRPWPVA